MALTTVHMRLMRSKDTKRTAFEIHHTNTASISFRSVIDKPISSRAADAMFAAATLLSGISFASVETLDPSQSWPMKPKPDSLQWLQLQQGISLMVMAAQPWRPDGAFAAAFQDTGAPGLEEHPIEPAIAQDLADTLEITSESTSENNAYFMTYEQLQPLLGQFAEKETIMGYLQFTAHLSNDYLALLGKRDHRALLLLAYWYCIVCRCGQWWITIRAIVECQSICLYLSLYAGAEMRGFIKEILDLLPGYPLVAN